MRILILILTLVVFISSCISSDKKDCGEMAEFKVDKAYCEKMSLPEVEFTVKYPKSFKSDPPEAGMTNYHYNYFLKWDENEVQTEAISLGYSTLQKNSFMKEQLAAEIYPQILEMWEQMGFSFTEEFHGKMKFDGVWYYMLKAKGEIDNKESEFVGKYTLVCIFLQPNVDNKNGLMVMMLANQDSEIKDYEDFATKGCVSQIWKSIKFNY